MGGGPVKSHDHSIDDKVLERESNAEIGTTTSTLERPEQQDEDGFDSMSNAAQYAPTSIEEPLSQQSEGESHEMATLLYSKSKVYLHPSTHTKDNIPGFLSIVRVDTDYLLAWIPEISVVNTNDYDAYVLVELAEPSSTSKADTLVTAPLVSSPHAFSFPIRKLYSLTVQQPTLTAWYGSMICTLYGGEEFPPLYFHDEESRSTILDRDRRVAALGALGSSTSHFAQSPSSSSPSSPSTSRARAPAPPSWGGEAVLSQIRKYAHVLRSQIEPRLFLINPSREDIEVHSTALFEDDAVPSEAMQGIRLRSRGDALRETDEGVSRSHREQNRRSSILHQSLDPASIPSSSSSGQEWPDDVPSVDNLTFSVLNSFSRLTRGARSGLQTAAQSVLSHPLAKPLAKHIPEPIAHFANAPGELTRIQETAGVQGFDAARVYLAQWARVVAEEGERARRAEVIVSGPGGKEENSDVGAFEVLSSVYKITKPKSTRAPASPIIVTEWATWFDDQGCLLLDELEAKKRIFQRGLSSDARRDVWPFLLKVFPWNSSTEQRKQIQISRVKQYEADLAKWSQDKELKKTERWVEENHRIEIDCRRTDRTHPMFLSDEPDAANHRYDSPHPPSNHHVRKMQEILTTYVFADPSRDYVQGMSDLLSPLYVVCDGEPWLVLGCFETVMERMKGNFLRDQSGMKGQLSRLQGLIRTMDPQLYDHLDRISSLNLFFAFRWLLCSFKRELSFDQTLQLWEVLYTDHLGTNFHLFIALSIIEAHRDIIIRYLREFDEILKYTNELSGTLDISDVIGDAEVLYSTFRQIIEACDRQSSADVGDSSKGLRKRTGTDSSSTTSYPPAAKNSTDQITVKVEPNGTTEIDDELRALLR